MSGKNPIIKDHIPKERKIPYSESGMWGDYHASEIGFVFNKNDKQGFVLYLFQLLGNIQIMAKWKYKFCNQ